MIYEVLYNGRSNIKEYSKVEISGLYKNTSSSKHQQNCKIQKTSEEIEDKKNKTS